MPRINARAIVYIKKLNKMEQEILFKAIPVAQRQPDLYGIYMVLLDGRLPMMAQYNPRAFLPVSRQK